MRTSGRCRSRTIGHGPRIHGWRQHDVSRQHDLRSRWVNGSGPAIVLGKDVRCCRGRGRGNRIDRGRRRHRSGLRGRISRRLICGRVLRCTIVGRRDFVRDGPTGLRRRLLDRFRCESARSGSARAIGRSCPMDPPMGMQPTSSASIFPSWFVSPGRQSNAVPWVGMPMCRPPRSSAPAAAATRHRGVGRDPGRAVDSFLKDEPADHSVGVGQGVAPDHGVAEEVEGIALADRGGVAQRDERQGARARQAAPNSSPVMRSTARSRLVLGHDLCRVGRFRRAYAIGAQDHEAVLIEHEGERLPILDACASQASSCSRCAAMSTTCQLVRINPSGETIVPLPTGTYEDSVSRSRSRRP